MVLHLGPFISITMIQYPRPAVKVEYNMVGSYEHTPRNLLPFDQVGLV